MAPTLRLQSERLQPPTVLLVCSGLDHALRGYESFARECFAALRHDETISLKLVKGSGAPGIDEYVAWTLRRDRAAAGSLGRLFKFRPFRLEALAFAAGLQPLLARRKPDLIYLSEWDTAFGLAHLRHIFRQRFALLLSNGGFAQTNFGHVDHVQELVPAARDHVISRGADPAKHTLLPYGFNLATEPLRVTTAERGALRRRFGLPTERPIVLSVAALNASHKRLDYLIAELAALPSQRPFLLLAGEPDVETPGILRAADTALGAAGYAIRTVRRHEVDDLYQLASIFVLPSLHETQGRAVIEAAGHCLPVLVHDSPVMRYALGNYGVYGDLREPGRLTDMLSTTLATTDSVLRNRGVSLHRHVYERFSWQQLRPRYIDMFHRVIEGHSTASATAAQSPST